MLKRIYRLELALAREALERFVNQKGGKTYLPLGANFERTEWLTHLNKDYYLSRNVIEGTGIFAYATPEEVVAAKMLLRICNYEHLCEAIFREDFIQFSNIQTGEHEKTARKLEVAIDSYFAGLCKIMGKDELLAAVTPNKVDAKTENQPGLEAIRFSPKHYVQEKAILTCLCDKGLDLMNLAPKKNGIMQKDKSTALEILLKRKDLFSGRSEFDAAWKRLEEEGKISFRH